MILKQGGSTQKRRVCWLGFSALLFPSLLFARPVSITLLFSSHLNGIEAGASLCPGIVAVQREVNAQRLSGKQVLWIDAGGTGHEPCGLERLREAAPDVVVPDRQTLTSFGAHELPDSLPMVALNAFCLPDYEGRDTAFLPYRLFELDGIRILVTALLHPRTPLSVPRDRLQHLGVFPARSSLELKLGELREQKADLRILVLDADWKGSDGWNVLDVARAFPDFHVVAGSAVSSRSHTQPFGGTSAPRVALQAANGGQVLVQVTASMNTLTRKAETLSVKTIRLRPGDVERHCGTLPDRMIKACDPREQLFAGLQKRYGVDAMVFSDGKTCGQDEPNALMDWVVAAVPFDDRWYSMRLSQEDWDHVKTRVSTLEGLSWVERTKGDRSAVRNVGLPGRVVAGWLGDTMMLRSRYDQTPDAVEALDVSSRALLIERLGMQE